MSSGAQTPPQDVLKDTYEKLYKPLVKDHEEIRLLYLLPGSRADQVACKLRTVRLNGEQRFIALSYVWGDPKVTTNILVDGYELPVTTNLEAALRTLRDGIPDVEFDSGWKPRPSWKSGSEHRPLSDQKGSSGSVGEGRDVPDDDAAEEYERRYWDGVRWNIVTEGKQPVPIWVDAICINQRDVAERGHQVSFMGRLYETANLVVSWLGDDDAATTQPVLEMVRKSAHVVSPIMEVFEHWGGIDRLHRVGDDEVLQKWEQILHSFVQGVPILRSNSRDSRKGELSNEYWYAFLHFSNIKYLARLWIYQEINLARSLIFIDGTEHCRMSDMVVLTAWSKAVVVLNWRRRRIWQLKGSALPPKIATRIPSQVDLAGVAVFAESIGTILEPLLKRTGSPAANQFTWFEAMKLMAHGNTSDPRDVVYAMIGIVNGHEIQPDYTKSKRQVFVDWFREALLPQESRISTGRILVISGVGHSPAVADPDFPSWLPGISRITHRKNRTSMIYFRLQSCWRQLGELPKVQDNDKLCLHGSLISEVINVWDLNSYPEPEYHNFDSPTRGSTLLFCFVNAYLDQLHRGIPREHGIKSDFESNFDILLYILDHLSPFTRNSEKFWDYMSGCDTVHRTILDYTMKALKFTNEKELWEYYRRAFQAHGAGKTESSRKEGCSEESDLTNRFFAKPGLRNGNDVQQWYQARLPTFSSRYEKEHMQWATNTSTFELCMTMAQNLSLLFIKHGDSYLLGASPCKIQPSDKIFAIAGVSHLTVMRETSSEGGEMRWVYVGPCEFPEIDDKWLKRALDDGRLQKTSLVVV